MCHKLVHQLVNVPFDQFFNTSSVQSTRGHPLKLFYPDSRINVHAHFFSARVIALRNHLPAALVQDKNLSAFKTRLRPFDLSYALLGKHRLSLDSSS